MPTHLPLITGAKEQRRPLPLIIGVAGHRDLLDEDRGRLRAQVEKIFDDLEKYYPQSKPFQLLSGLAEGADRLVAHVALSRGAHLIACLPMKHDLYETDFETEASRREFADLLHRASERHEEPLVHGNTPANIHQPKARDFQYDSLGKYLVRKCQVLIALWDGVETDLTGGTSAVVSLQLYGPWGKDGINPEDPLRFPDTGPVFHILTPRRSNPAPMGNLEKRHVLYPADFEIEEKIKKHYTKFFFRRANLFNIDAARLATEDRPQREKSKNALLPKGDREKLDDPMQQLIDRYAAADCLALFYQGYTKWAFRVLIFLFGLAGVFSFEYFAHGPENVQSIWLNTYLAIIVVAYVFYRWVKYRDVKTRHLDYRSLAEGLRLEIFWKLAGLKESVVDHFLTKQRTELNWVRDAIRRWSAPASPLQTPNWQLVGTHWIRNQFDFFSTAARKNHLRHAIEHVSYWILVGFTFALGILALDWLIQGRLHDRMHQNWLKGFDLQGLLVLTMTMLPAAAGAISAYAIKMAFSEQRRQYERMKELYQRGLFCFEKAMQMPQQYPSFRARVVFQLGKEALSENADWVLMHRERIVEIFVGG
jgi:hypothetical protein